MSGRFGPNRDTSSQRRSKVSRTPGRPGVAADREAYTTFSRDSRTSSICWMEGNMEVRSKGDRPLSTTRSQLSSRRGWPAPGFGPDRSQHQVPHACCSLRRLVKSLTFVLIYIYILGKEHQEDWILLRLSSFGSTTKIVLHITERIHDRRL